jgi:hypothetical protein
MSGEPCFKGTRVPVQALIDHIEGNLTLDDFLEGSLQSAASRLSVSLSLPNSRCSRAYPPRRMCFALDIPNVRPGLAPAKADPRVGPTMLALAMWSTCCPVCPTRVGTVVSWPYRGTMRFRRHQPTRCRAFSSPTWPRRPP